jgi:hypothetical protein
VARGKRPTAEPDVVHPWKAIARRLAAALVAVGLLAAFGVVGWRQWGPSIVQSPDYLLDEEKFEVTPQPAWIHANVKRDAIRAGGLAELSILDPKLTDKVQHAFAVQTWVASVRRITKQHPARVVVELEYRRPVAMVEVIQGEERGLLPVDSEGVLLPPEDFSANQVKNYLRVAVGVTQPQGPVGTPWGDARVASGARIATSLDEVWSKLQLYRIVLVGESGLQAPTFDIVTRDGARVIWGHAPGEEVSGEATASEKVAQLRAWHEQHGPLTATGGVREINVREGIRPAIPALPARLRK